MEQGLEWVGRGGGVGCGGWREGLNKGVRHLGPQPFHHEIIFMLLALLDVVSVLLVHVSIPTRSRGAREGRHHVVVAPVDGRLGGVEGGLEGEGGR